MENWILIHCYWKWTLVQPIWNYLVLWVDCVHTQKVMLQSLPPIPPNGTLFGNRVIADIISLFKRMPSYRKVGLSSNMTDVLTRIWPSEDAGERSCESEARTSGKNGGRAWTYAATRGVWGHRSLKRQEMILLIPFLKSIHGNYYFTKFLFLIYCLISFSTLTHRFC